MLSKCADKMTRREAVGSFVAITFVNRFGPIGVLSVKLSSSTCQFKAFSVEIIYSLTMVLFSVSTVRTYYLLAGKYTFEANQHLTDSGYKNFRQV